MIPKILLFLLTLACFVPAHATDKPVIRVGAMASGTLAWELAAMKNEGLLQNSNFVLEIVNLANQQAGKVALQSGSVDLIVSDWIWVSSMRAEGADYTFTPYSDTSGGLIVPADSGINSLSDLKGKKIGIAGGELDKNWLLLQALGLKQGIDLNKSTEPVYGAPPLLNQQLSEQRIDALLTYWQFATRLQAQGYRQLLSGEDIVRQLGIQESVPSLGYVFNAGWGKQNPAVLAEFFKTSQIARDALCNKDEAWQKIGKLTEAEGPAALLQLRTGYCQGRVEHWGEANRKAAENIYQLLHQLSGNKLTGKNPQLQNGTFWLAD